MSDVTEPLGDDVSALGYAQAQSELDAILRELEGDSIDVDLLVTKVRRAAVLIRLCRSRISAARMEVDQVVSTLDDQDDHTS